MQNNGKSNSRRIAYASVSTAIASLAIILTNFLPLRISLLMVAAAAYYIAFEKSGIMYGLLAIAASILISFFTKPFSSAFFLNIIVFAPYSVIAYFIKKLYYTKLPHILLRVLIMAVFSNIAFMGIYFLARFIDFDILMLVERLTYAGLTLILTVFCIAFDLMFNQVILRVSKLVK